MSKVQDKKDTKTRHTRKVTNKKCQEMTVKDIKAHPKYKTIEGRSTMNKEDLCKALVKASKPKKTKVVKTKVEKTKVEKTKVAKTKVEKTKVEKPAKTKVEKTKVEKTKVEKPVKAKVEKTKVVKPKKTQVEKTKIASPKPKSVKKAPKPLPKPKFKHIDLLSPLKEVQNRDLSVLDIQDLIRKSPKNKYLKPIPKTVQKNIEIHAQRNLGKAEKQNTQKYISPFKQSPKKIDFDKADYIPIVVKYDDESITLFKRPDDFWQTVINDLPEKWGDGKLYHYYMSNKWDLAPFSKIPTTIYGEIIFEPEYSIFNLLF